MKDGSLGRAKKLYEKADKLAAEPFYAIEEGLSRIHFLLGDHGESLAASRRALDLAGNPQERAASLSRIGALLFAIAMVDPDGVAESADVEHTEREVLIEEAETALRESLDISEGRFAMPWFNLAELLYEREQLQEAKDAIDRHIALMPAGFLSRRANKLQACLREMTHADIEGEPEPWIKRIEGSQITRPRKISGPNPQYPEAARSHRIQGAVIVQSVITKNGDVVCTRPLRGLPFGLTRATTDALSEWKFEPARLDGQPVSVYYNLTVNFRLNKRQIR